MLIGVTSQKQLEEFLAAHKPRQKIKVVFLEGQPGVTLRVAGMVTAGLLSTLPMTTATLLSVGWRGEWGADGRVFEFELTDGFRQPDASQIVAEAIWFGVYSIEVVGELRG